MCILMEMWPKYATYMEEKTTLKPVDLYSGYIIKKRNHSKECQNNIIRKVVFNSLENRVSLSCWNQPIPIFPTVSKNDEGKK